MAAQDDAGRADDGRHGVALVGAQEHHELADERAQYRAATDPTRPAMQERARQQRGDLLHAAVVGDELRAAAVDQEARDQEQHAGREPVVDHVERRARGRRGWSSRTRPSLMNPKCEIEVYAMSRLMSV